MKRSVVFVAAIIFVLNGLAFAQKGGAAGVAQLSGPQNPRLGFVIHGGAGRYQER
jgi:hypothetical protein